MASEQSIVDYIVDQISMVDRITTKKMFGEYALYCDGKVVALICDDQLFVKQTDKGENFIGNPIFKAPFPGAKFWFLITGDLWDDSEWLTELIKITADQLPIPKPKKPKKEKIKNTA